MTCANKVPVYQRKSHVRARPATGSNNRVKISRATTLRLGGVSPGMRGSARPMTAVTICASKPVSWAAESLRKLPIPSCHVGEASLSFFSLASLPDRSRAW